MKKSTLPECASVRPVQTPFGVWYLAVQDGAVTALTAVPLPCAGEREADTPLLNQAEEQLADYFRGNRTRFTLPLRPGGTPFQRAVWDALLAIPYGETRSYGELAAALGRPKAARAVGGGCHRNPILVFIPCHRVVGRGGALTGFGAGLAVKERLLALESAEKEGAEIHAGRTKG